MKTDNIKDLLTDEPFEKKRINQKFSCPQNRIKYYNIKANFIRQGLAYINKPLHKNYSIISSLLGFKEEGTYHKFFLQGRGFDFNVCTSFEIIDGRNYPAIYDYVIIPIEENNIKIVKLTRHD